MLSEQESLGRNRGSPADASLDDDGTIADAAADGPTQEGGPAVVLPCMPGTYSGSFVGSARSVGDGGASLSSTDAAPPPDDGGTFPYLGQLSVALEAVVTTHDQGAISETMFSADSLSGTDVYGGSFNATLNGTFDCATGTLSATFEGGTYVLVQLVPQALAGTLSARYDGTTSPPTLRIDEFHLLISGLLGLDADGSCSATLQ